MKLISWNVNGLRACMQKGFAEFFTASDADIFCIQESKLQEGQIDFAPEGYYAYWNYAQKKGYSGTAIFTRKEPLSVHYGIGISQHDTEGRVITLEFPDFYMVTCYTPNSQNELARQMGIPHARISEATHGKQSGNKYIVPIIEKLDGDLNDFKEFLKAI